MNYAILECISVIQCYIICYRYAAVLVWIPELFSRYYAFNKLNLDGKNICLASKWILSLDSEQLNKIFKKPVTSDAYLAAFIVALSTMPLAILMGIIIKYVNKKILLCMYISNCKNV